MRSGICLWFLGIAQFNKIADNGDRSRQDALSSSGKPALPVCFGVLDYIKNLALALVREGKI